MIIRIFPRIIIVTYSFPEEKIGCLESLYPPLCRHLPAQEAGLPLPTRLGCNQLPSGPVLFYHPQCKYNRIITYNCTIHCESQRSKGTAVSAALPDPRGGLHGGRQVGAARPGAHLFLFGSFSFILVLFVQSTFGGVFFSLKSDLTSFDLLSWCFLPFFDVLSRGPGFDVVFRSEA